MSQVAQELRVIADRLASVSLTPPVSGRAKRNRRRRARKNANGAVVAPPVQQAQMSQVAGRRRRRRGVNRVVDGAVSVSRCEMLTEVKGTDYLVIKLVPSSFSWLSNLAKSFDRVVWLSMRLMWKPAVGTTTDGLVSYGVDWNFSINSFNDRKKISGLTPNNSHPVWQSSEKTPLVLPVSKLMSRREYSLSNGDDFDKGPGQVLIATSASATTVVGELWVEYKVQFFGTQF